MHTVVVVVGATVVVVVGVVVLGDAARPLEPCVVVEVVDVVDVVDVVVDEIDEALALALDAWVATAPR